MYRKATQEIELKRLMNVYQIMALYLQGGLYSEEAFSTGLTVMSFTHKYFFCITTHISQIYLCIYNTLYEITFRTCYLLKNIYTYFHLKYFYKKITFNFYIFLKKHEVRGS